MYRIVVLATLVALPSVVAKNGRKQSELALANLDIEGRRTNVWRSHLAQAYAITDRGTLREATHDGPFDTDTGAATHDGLLMASTNDGLSKRPATYDSSTENQSTEKGNLTEQIPGLSPENPVTYDSSTENQPTEKDKVTEQIPGLSSPSQTPKTYDSSTENQSTEKDNVTEQIPGLSSPSQTSAHNIENQSRYDSPADDVTSLDHIATEMPFSGVQDETDDDSDVRLHYTDYASISVPRVDITDRADTLLESFDNKVSEVLDSLPAVHESVLETIAKADNVRTRSRNLVDEAVRAQHKVILDAHTRLATDNKAVETGVLLRKACGNGCEPIHGECRPGLTCAEQCKAKKLDVPGLDLTAMCGESGCSCNSISSGNQRE